MQISTKDTNDRKIKANNKMAINILGDLPINQIFRIDVNFKIKEKNMDSFIG